jgi:hypothetical protein
MGDGMERSMSGGICGQRRHGQRQRQRKGERPVAMVSKKQMRNNQRNKGSNAAAATRANNQPNEGMERRYGQLQWHRTMVTIEFSSTATAPDHGHHCSVQRKKIHRFTFSSVKN